MANSRLSKNLAIFHSSHPRDDRRTRRRKPGPGGRRLENKARAVPGLELLEGRTLLSTSIPTFTVTSTGTANVPGTLLYEINSLNSTGGTSNILNFNIGSGVQTISPTSALPLPTITKPVTIEGTVSGGVPQVQILGGSAGSGASGLTFGSGSSGSSVQDLVIAGFASGDAINITSSSTGDSVLGCWLGINASGTAGAMGTADANIEGVLDSGSGATIGGTTTGAGNIISGNTSHGVDIEASSCLVVGNKIGTNADGNAALGNGHDGLDVFASGATIGGSTAGAGNIISGNTDSGVYIDASSCLVEGNEIGTNALDTAAVANGYGIYVDGTGATIGGSTAGAANIISGNTNNGVQINRSCLVVGNDIGTNAAGTSAVANGYGIDVAAVGATIGGSTAGAGNTISDNRQGGIDVTSGSTATITNDSITGNGTGILVGSGASDTCLVTVQDDDLSGNTTAGITNNQTNSADTVTATDDWWGSLHGPTTTANPGGNGASVSANVNFSPWIGVYTAGAGPGFQPTDITLYFEVTSTADSGPGTLRAAVTSLDSSGAPYNIITFDLGSSGPQTITLLSPLLPINAPVDIEGNTEPGFSGVPLVVISGSSAGSGINGLALAAGSSGSTIQSVVLNGFGGDGVDGVDSVDSVDIASTNDSVIGCYIGTNAAGTAAVDNGTGIYVGGSGATIGGATTGDANVISGNNYGVDIDASSCLVVSNKIGTNADGAATVENGYGIYVDGSGATIGGSTAGAGNIICGSLNDGIYIGASSCLVVGNDIGNAAGNAMANLYGIYVGGSGATIGGTTTGAANVVSGNRFVGVDIVASSSLVVGNKIGTNAARHRGRGERR